MIQLPTDDWPWYTEIRAINDPEKVSLDLARHLSLRSAIGPVVIVTDRPTVLLPVIRKRWTKIIQEFDRQYSSTLDRAKKESLRIEALRLRKLTFAANTAYVAPPADVIFTSVEHPYKEQSYGTLYTTLPLTKPQLQQHTACLCKNGVIVDYKTTDPPT